MSQTHNDSSVAHTNHNIIATFAASFIFPGSNDFALDALHRQSVVAQTKISFPKKQLLHLIGAHLSKVGLPETAATLRREAKLDLMTPTSKLMVQRTVGTPAGRPLSALSNARCVSPPPASSSYSSQLSQTPPSSRVAEATTNGNGASSVPIRISRRNIRSQAESSVIG